MGCRECFPPPLVASDLADLDRHWHRRRLLRGDDLPITPFLQAGADGACLASLFDHERGAALRAGLRNGPIRRREIAFRVAVAPIEDAAASFSGHTLQQLAGTAFRAVDAQRLGANELALRVGRAADKFAVAAVLAHQLRTAVRAV